MYFKCTFFIIKGLEYYLIILIILKFIYEILSDGNNIITILIMIKKK